MSADKAWKAAERVAAALFGAKRFPANMGGRMDFQGGGFLGQVKNVARLSLASLEGLAIEMEAIAAVGNNVGVVTVKRRAGQGTPTPYLVVMTAHEWGKVKRRLDQC